MAEPSTSLERVRAWRNVSPLILLALLLRVTLLDVLPNIPVKFDQASYAKQAARLVKQGPVKWRYDLRAPGYIAFLAWHLRSATRRKSSLCDCSRVYSARPRWRWYTGTRS